MLGVDRFERPIAVREKNFSVPGRAKDAQLVVEALVATVTFAAAITMPGGFKNKDPNQGIAILSENAAFILFFISDAMAMVLSISAVFLHLFMVIRSGGETEEEVVGAYYFWTVILTMCATPTMVIAFITGSYAVLATSLGLAITICFIGLTFFAFMIPFNIHGRKWALLTYNSPRVNIEEH